MTTEFYQMKKFCCMINQKANKTNTKICKTRVARPGTANQVKKSTP